MQESLGANYRKLWAASSLSNLADGVFQVALPLLALRITQSPTEIAGLALASRLPWLLFALHAGALADRLDRRVTMTRVDVGRAVMIGGLAAVAAAGREELWILYVVAFVLGIGETLFDTSAQSLMPSLVPAEQPEPRQRPAVRGRAHDEPVRRSATGRRARGRVGGARVRRQRGRVTSSPPPRCSR